MTGDCMFIELYDVFGGLGSLTKDVRIVGVAAFAGEFGASGLLTLGLLALAGRCWIGAEDWRCCIAVVASELVDGRERFSVARRAPLIAAFDRVPFGAGVVYTRELLASEAPHTCLVWAVWAPQVRVPTFRKQASIAIVHVSAQEPTIAKVVVPLYQLNAVSLGQAQLVGAARYEVVHDQQYGAGRGICHAALSCRHVGAVCGVVSGVRAQVLL